jgi:S1-C subfamily serine protease
VHSLYAPAAGRLSRSCSHCSGPQQPGHSPRSRFFSLTPGAGNPADRAGLRRGDLVLTAAGRPVTVAQSLQRLMFADAIGRPLQITVLRNGAMVDVIAEPTELSNQAR